MLVVGLFLGGNRFLFDSVISIRNLHHLRDSLHHCCFLGSILQLSNCCFFLYSKFIKLMGQSFVKLPLTILLLPLPWSMLLLNGSLCQAASADRPIMFLPTNCCQCIVFCLLLTSSFSQFFFICLLICFSSEHEKSGKGDKENFFTFCLLWCQSPVAVQQPELSGFCII